jgi:hypothetical protein
MFQLIRLIRQFQLIRLLTPADDGGWVPAVVRFGLVR